MAPTDPSTLVKLSEKRLESFLFKLPPESLKNIGNQKDPGPLVEHLQNSGLQDILILGPEVNHSLITALNAASIPFKTISQSELHHTDTFEAEIILCLEVLNTIPLEYGANIVNKLLNSTFERLYINTCEDTLINIRPHTHRYRAAKFSLNTSYTSINISKTPFLITEDPSGFIDQPFLEDSPILQIPQLKFWHTSHKICFWVRNDLK